MTHCKIAFTPILTKISPPEIKHHQYHRSRFKLNTYQEKEHIIFINSPAGFGKSTLMLQWFQHLKDNQHFCSWLNLDDEDNDLSRLLRYFLASLKQSQVSDFPNSSRLLNAGSLPSSMDFREQFRSDLKKLKENIFFFVDDFHKVKQKDVKEFWDWLIATFPRKINFIIASRNKINLEWKQQKNLHEIDNLSFSQKETQHYFIEVQKLKIPNQVILEINRKTEGWIAALQLCSLILRENQLSTKFIKEFTGRNQELMSYLAETMINQQEPELQEFMIKSSLLDQFCPNLCNSILNKKNSSELISKADQKNLFLITLDHDKKWFRYHHLFQDFLKSYFHRYYPNKDSALYLRASKWFEKENLRNEAIHYAIKARDFDRAVALLSIYAIELTSFQGDHSTLFQWMEDLPKEYWIRHPIIWVGYITSLILSNLFGKARTELNQIKNLFQNHSANNLNMITQNEWNYFSCYFEMLEILYGTHSGDLDYVKYAGPRWLKKWKKTDPFQEIAVVFDNTIPKFYEFDFKTTLLGLKKAYQVMIKSDNFYAMAWFTFWIGLVYLEQGRLQKSYQEVNYYLDRLRKYFPKNSFPIMMNRLHLIEQNFELGNLEQIENLLKMDFTQFDAYGGFISLVSIYRNIARYLIIIGKFQDAEKKIAHALRLSEKRGTFFTTMWLNYQKIILKINYGQLDLARHLSNNFFSPEQIEIQNQTYLKILSQDLRNLIQTRIYLKEINPTEACMILNPMIIQAKKLRRTRHLLTLLLLKIKACLQLNHRESAKTILMEALMIAVPEGFVMIFVEELAEYHEFILQELIKLKVNSKLKHTMIQSWKTKFRHVIKLGYLYENYSSAKN